MKNNFRFLLMRGLLASALCIGVCYPSAAEEQEALMVNLKNGTRVVYILAERPVATFATDKLHIESSALADDYAIADIANFKFDKVSSISGVETDDMRVCFIDGENLRLEGLRQGEIVTICDTKGCIMTKAKSSADGKITIQMSSLPYGVYIVSLSSGKTFKLLNK